MLELQAIIPKGKAGPTPQDIQRGVDKALRNFAFGTVAIMQEYPAWRPWKGRPPTKGPRAGGKRTGGYGRGWSQRITFWPDSVRVVNPVKYARYVGGPTTGNIRQARALRARGWKSITDVAPKLRAKYAPVFLRAIKGG